MVKNPMLCRESAPLQGMSLVPRSGIGWVPFGSRCSDRGRRRLPPHVPNPEEAGITAQMSAVQLASEASVMK
jgi:hypothetical protein